MEKLWPLVTSKLWGPMLTPALCEFGGTSGSSGHSEEELREILGCVRLTETQETLLRVQSVSPHQSVIQPVRYLHDQCFSQSGINTISDSASQVSTQSVIQSVRYQHDQWFSQSGIYTISDSVSQVSTRSVFQSVRYQHNQWFSQVPTPSVIQSVRYQHNQWFSQSGINTISDSASQVSTRSVIQSVRFIWSFKYVS